jgi:hypothetical protein
MPKIWEKSGLFGAKKAFWKGTRGRSGSPIFARSKESKPWGTRRLAMASMAPLWASNSGA